MGAKIGERRFSTVEGKLLYKKSFGSKKIEPYLLPKEEKKKKSRPRSGKKKMREKGN